MANDDLTVKVDANTNSYDAAILRAQQSTFRYETSLKSLESELMKLEKQLDDDVAAALQRQHDAMTKVGRGAFVFGAAVAAGLGLAVNEAIKWESAWTGVTKTVDGSAPQMEALEQDLRNLATTLPATHEEIAAVAEAAGQLGIKREAIIGFTKTMIDLSETTNLTAEQAATDMARFANIMQTPQDQVDRLGAALVALGNDGASTEAEILSMATRIAGAGAQLGLTEGEVMAIANALSSVGVEAEAGGSAISQVMKGIQLEVSTGGDRLEGFARVAGMSAKEFAAAWREDPAAALNAFVTGLGRIKAEGGDTIKTLADLEVTQIRQSDALLRLAGAGDLLGESLELGNRAWEENSALVEEAEKRYATTEAQVAIARNTLRDTAIDVGNVLVPAVAAVVDVTADMLRAWQDLPGPLRTGAVLMAGLAAAVGIFGGAALIAIPKIAAFQAAVAGLEAGALRRAGTGLIGLGRFLAGPWGLAIAGGIAALSLFAAKHGEAARDVDALKATLDAQTGALTENSAEWVIKKLSDEGAFDAARTLGIELGTLTDAALGNADAIETVTGAYRENYDELLARKAAGEDISATAIEEAKASKLLADAIGNTNGVVAEGVRQFEEEQEAKAGSVEASKAAAGAQDGATEAWQGGAEAAGELTEEVKSLGEQLAELSENFLNQREAGRAVRGTLRDIRGALKDYREEHGSLQGAFKDGTASGDEFAGMLDDLAEDYLRQIETTEKLTGSQRQTMGAYREARASLHDVATQLGMTDKEARTYIDTILGTPKEARTKFQAETGQALADARALKQALDEAARDRQARIDITLAYHGGNRPRGLQEADGGIVQAYADGGFSTTGSFVHRVPQMRQGGGTVQWNEPETGWEAYISGKPGMRDRNREVWTEAGRRLGLLETATHEGGGGRTVVVREVERMPGQVVLEVPGMGRLIANVTQRQIAAADDFDRRLDDRD